MGGAILAAFLLMTLAVCLTIFAGMWAAFAKAGQPGWSSLVPVYNLYVMTKMAGKPAWWTLLCLVPLVGIVFLFLVHLEMAKAFGKGAGYAVGLLLLCFIFWPMLGFGDAAFQRAAPPAAR